MRSPLRVKGEFARANIIKVLELIEHGLLTNYDPTLSQRGGSLFVTPQGAATVWQNVQ